MTPCKRSPILAIAIPASLISDTPHLREKTSKIGLIGRAAAIFRVDEIIVFPDNPKKNQSRDSELISTILSYMETPQYLRRYLFPIKRSLRYVGVLPPLRTPHHPRYKRARELKRGDVREGVVVKSDKSKSLVDIGVEELATLWGKRIPPKSRLTVKIKGVRQGSLEVSMTDRKEINIYWGYRVTVSSLPLGRMIERGSYDFVVFTSRHGKPLTRILRKFKSEWGKARSVLVAFGSPEEGLIEILKREKTSINEAADWVVNTIPRQGTETVRTEEAVYATLSIINMISEIGGHGKWVEEEPKPREEGH